MKTIPSRLSGGFCAHGHDLKEHGYERPDGRGVTCRACNSLSASRARGKKGQTAWEVTSVDGKETIFTSASSSQQIKKSAQRYDAALRRLAEDD